MKSVMVVHDMAPTVLPTGNDEDGTRKLQILAPLFGCGFKYASITAKHRLRGGVLMSVWERLHQTKTKN